MPADLLLKCKHCGSHKFGAPTRERDGPSIRIACLSCRTYTTRKALYDAAELRFGREVDGALSRVRKVTRRFPDRGKRAFPEPVQ
jgi:hypothetical protein